MTRNDVKGFFELINFSTDDEDSFKIFLDFARVVAAAEREACAKHFDGSDYMMYRSEVAAAIRERGAP
jgi:hypothetical protein